MKKLPSAKYLANKVLATKHGKSAISGSEQYLLEHRTQLAKYLSVEQLVTTPDDRESELRRACDHHLLLLRSQLARELWSRQLFIGVSVLDDLLFQAVAHETTSSPTLRVLEQIRDHRLHHPGLLVFPVHSFGVLAAGLLTLIGKARLECVFPEFGIALAPQSNSSQETMRYLERTQKAFGIRKSVPVGLIEHWQLSRSAHWLTQNPLLVVKVQSFPGDYYENQFLLLRRLRIATAFVSMLAALQPTEADRREQLFSSSMINNFQTLDIKHYIVLYNAPSSPTELRGDCVPMHLRGSALAEISDLSVELDFRYWTRRRSMPGKLRRALDTVHSGYLRNSFGAAREAPLGRTYRKLFEALTYFRRSFLPSDDDWAAIVSLAIAFEMLLTDSFAKGVANRVAKRSRLALRGTPGTRQLVAAVEALYRARGAVVHSGRTDTTVDLVMARRAFVHVYISVASRLNTLSPTSSTPMKDLCGDT